MTEAMSVQEIAGTVASAYPADVTIEHLENPRALARELVRLSLLVERRWARDYAPTAIVNAPPSSTQPCSRVDQ